MFHIVILVYNTFWRATVKTISAVWVGQGLSFGSRDSVAITHNNNIIVTEHLVFPMAIACPQIFGKLKWKAQLLYEGSCYQEARFYAGHQGTDSLKLCSFCKFSQTILFSCIHLGRKEYLLIKFEKVRVTPTKPSWFVMEASVK